MEEKKEKLGFFARLKAGLTKTRKNIVYNIDSVFNQYEEISEEFYDKLEEVLIMGDIGVEATEKIMDQLREDVIDGNYHKPAECKALLIRAIWQQMRVDNVEYKFEEEQSIVMIIGVNGVGKTTTIGKLASKLKSKGKKVVIAAADTFRAAAT
ncbi:MAG: signal recognition particle receptor subunit alpha, partial [Lachnospiraceae bacterium]|nr:signal recognition particle receptor subunit alpha [Lachnospiraceae bacterium]